MSTGSMTVQKIQEKKQLGQRLSALTCYDATFAQILDQQTTVDLLLVGDSLGTVIKGDNNTLNVSLAEMIYHTKIVARQVKRAHLVADMPFLSYQINDDDTLRHAGELIKAGAHSIKVEGGKALHSGVKKLVNLGIPVMGHIGLTPQHVHAFGGYRVQGKTLAAKERLIEDALALEDAGAYALVIECTPADVAKEITSRIKIPTIGIGAGPFCDGQILVLYDLLDLKPEFRPKFVKQFLNGAALISNACQSYVDEVQEGSFPGPEHSYHFKNIS